MAVDAFLKVVDAQGNTIDGESFDEFHAKQIEVLTWTFGGTSPSTPGGGGGGRGAGKVSLHEFTITKNIDKASPAFFKALVSGSHYKEAILSVRRRQADTQDFLKYTLSTVQVTSFNAVGHGEDSEPREVDSVAFAFQKVAIFYKPQIPTGALAPTDTTAPADWTVVSWD